MGDGQAIRSPVHRKHKTGVSDAGEKAACASPSLGVLHFKRVEEGALLTGLGQLGRRGKERQALCGDFRPASAPCARRAASGPNTFPADLHFRAQLREDVQVGGRVLLVGPSGGINDS